VDVDTAMRCFLQAAIIVVAVSTSTTATTTSTIATTTSAPSPTLSQDYLTLTCPLQVQSCKANASCNSAWQCMATAKKDCDGFYTCFLDAWPPRHGPLKPLEDLAACLRPACDTTTWDVALDFPDVVQRCEAETLCGSAWECMASSPGCEPMSRCIKEAAGVSAPSSQLEELASCLKQECAPEPHTTITRIDIFGYDPAFSLKCEAETMCDGAWECMALSPGCEPMAMCIDDAAGVSAPSSQLEQLAGYLKYVCAAEATLSPSALRSSSRRATREAVSVV